MTNEMFEKLHDLKRVYAIISNQINGIVFHENHNSPQKQMDLTYQQVQALYMLKFYDRRTLSSLAKMLNTDRSNTARTMRSLLENGFCLKQNENGKKAVYFSITEKGLNALEEIRALNRNMYLDIYDKHLSLNEQNELIELFDRITKIYSKIQANYL